MKKTTIYLSVALFSLSVMYLCSCGHKSALHPPAPLRVARVEDVRTEIGCGKILLSWNPVFVDDRGQPLENDVSYLVLRRRGEHIEGPTVTPTPTEAVTPESGMEIPSPTVTTVPTTVPSASVSPTPTAIPTPDTVLPEYEFKLIAVVPGNRESVVGAEMETLRLRFEDSGLPGVFYPTGITFRKPRDFPPEQTEEDIDLISDYSYFYKIQAVDSQGMTSEDSDTVEIRYHKIPGPPMAVQAIVTEQFVEITWLEPETSCDSKDPAQVGGYFVERTKAESPDEFSTIATLTDLDKLVYEDESFEFDTQYYYRIRAFTSLDRLPGLPSSAILVDTEDVYPPEAPENLNSATSPRGTHLFWKAPPDTDIEGYRIYRKTGKTGEYMLLTESNTVKDTVYIDTDVVPGKTYFYYVTAVDSSRKANESKPSQPTRVVVP